MGFFNRKEDVIDLQLTQHGKYLLSLGKLKPLYYAFFDDDIIYDNQHTGIIEEQNEAKPRIQEALRPKTQYVFSSIESRVHQTNEHYFSNEKKLSEIFTIQPTAEKHYALASPLGTSELGNPYNPQWIIEYLDADLSSSANFTTGSNFNLRTPQLNSTIYYDITVDKEAFLDFSPNTWQQSVDKIPVSSPEAYAEMAGVFIQGNSLLLQINERNVMFDKDNFEIEVCKVETQIIESNQGAGSATTKEILLPLYFARDKEYISDIDDFAGGEFMDVDSNYVEYYFNVFVDKEIDEEFLCAAVKGRGAEDVFIDDILDCPDETLAGISDILVPPEQIRECD